MKKNNFLRALSLALLLLTILLSMACRSTTPKQDPGMTPVMRDAYGALNDLYRLVWSADSFYNEKKEQSIQILLTRLQDDFQKVALLHPKNELDPGYRIALEMQQDVVKDVAQRFKQGQKDYAAWRLRGLYNNCIACHTRVSANVDFFDKIKVIPDGTHDGQIAAAEYLVATRKFDQASSQLFKLAKETLSNGRPESEAVDALKYWLVVEVRVKNRLSESAKKLQRLIEEKNVSANSLLETWKNDLLSLAEDQDSTADAPIDFAEELLVDIDQSPPLNDQEQLIVRTLHATHLLHEVLERDDLDQGQRRQATFLLAGAYTRLPIRSLEGLAPLYLEQCIKQYPGSTEAQRAYQLFSDLLELESAGSGGLHLEQEDIEKRAELRSIAFGTSS